MGDEKEAGGGFIHLLSTPLMGSQQLSSLISKFNSYTAAYRWGERSARWEGGEW